MPKCQVGSRPNDRVSILAGDLNLRDAELVASGGLPDRTVSVIFCSPIRPKWEADTVVGKESLR